MKKLILIITLASFSLLGQNNSAKKTALEFVSALYVEANGPKALTYIDSSATGKSLRNMKTMLQQNKLPKLDLRNISFFYKKDIPFIKESIHGGFPKTRKSIINSIFRRIERRINNNLGCVVIFNTQQNNIIPMLNIFIFKKIGSTYRIVYQDDN